MELITIFFLPQSNMNVIVKSQNKATDIKVSIFKEQINIKLEFKATELNHGFFHDFAYFGKELKYHILLRYITIVTIAVLK